MPPMWYNTHDGREKPQKREVIDMARKLYWCSNKQVQGYWIIRYTYAGLQIKPDNMHRIPMRNARYIAKVQSTYGGDRVGLIPWDCRPCSLDSLTPANLSLPAQRRLAYLARGGDIDHA